MSKAIKNTAVIDLFCGIGGLSHGFANVIRVRAKLDGDCDTNTIFTINFEITDSNGNLVELPFSETVSDVSASVLRYDRTYLGFQKEGKYKICVWIEREGMNCKSAKVCCEFYVKETKEKKPDCCKPIGKSEKDLPFNNGKSKMRTRLLIVNTFLLPYSSISAKTKFYKKIGSKWKARKASRISVAIAGDYHQLYCNGPNKIVNTGIKERYNKKEVLLLKYTGILIFIKKDKMTSAHNMSGYSLGDNIRKIVSC
jgi:hypothetical protein